MGWNVKFVSSYRNDFNYDFHVSFQPEEIADGEVNYNFTMQKVGSDELSGRSVFLKDGAGDIFHTYSAFARGGEAFLGTYAVLDITPKGRDETISGNLTDWVPASRPLRQRRTRCFTRGPRGCRGSGAVSSLDIGN